MIDVGYAHLRVVFLLLLTLIAVPGAEGFAPLVLQSGETKIPLLELYTSEGCSSCPPAEHWFSKLKNDPRLWVEFVPVAFHVDYWNYLGWNDSYSSAAYSARQRAYATVWQAGNIYTPEFVLDGKEWSPAFGEIPRPQQISGSLSATFSANGKVEVHFKPSSQRTISYVTEVALLASDINSSVTRGENAGMVLHHDFVVTDLLKSNLTRNKNGTFEAALTLPPHPSSPSSAIAVWVREEKNLIPIQSVGGWLH